MSTEAKSGKLPWMKFYPGDWRKDPGVQALDYETKGIWFEIICLMHESDHRGRLMLNNQPMPEEALARLLGLDQAKVKQTLSKLLAYGVAELEQTTGIVYCRRMVREDALHEKRADAGGKGGKARAEAVCLSKIPSNGQANPKQIPDMSEVRSQKSEVRATEQQGAVAPAAGAAPPPDSNDEAPPLALSTEPPPKPPAPLAGAEKLAADMAAAERRRNRAPAPVAVPIPIILDTESFRLRWASWLQYRREMKKPLTPTSQAQQLDNFLKIGEARAIAMIEHTITMGWQGLREPEAPAANGAPPRAGPGNIGAIMNTSEVTHPTHDFGLGQLSDGSFITPAGKKIMDQRPNNVF